MRPVMQAFFSFVAVLSLVATTPSVSRAQTAEGLEQSYARLCGSGQQTEVCTVLRQALAQKLTGQTESSPSLTPSSDGSAARLNPTRPPQTNVGPSDEEQLFSKWGVYARLAGNKFRDVEDANSVKEYDWIERGVLLRLQNRSLSPRKVNSEINFRYDEARREIVGEKLAPGESFTARVESDGSVAFRFTEGDQVDDGKLVIDSDGTMWQTVVTVVGSKEVARGNYAYSRVTGNDDQSLASVAEQQVFARWGIYARMVGNKWLTRKGFNTELDIVSEYEWFIPGEVIRRTDRVLADGEFVGGYGYHYLPQESAIEVKSSSPEGMVKLGNEKIQSDGNALGDGESHGTRTRWSMTLIDDENARWVWTGTDAMGKVTTYDDTYTRITGQDERALAESLKRKSGVGGVLRAVIGAGMGVAAARTGGMDAEQTVGMAAKGVALMNPESQAAQVIGAAGDATLQSSGLGAAAGGASAGSTAGASYPTKPNVLAGQAACSMMNESNYRQVAVSGGNDVQLKTMCGQAYEYYVMYKRAIAQGYSEADANRTYAAHAQSARVAISHYTSSR